MFVARHNGAYQQDSVVTAPHINEKGNDVRDANGNRPQETANGHGTGSNNNGSATTTAVQYNGQEVVITSTYEPQRR